MAAAASSIAAEESSKKNHKLTKVVSTKLSIEDDNFLQLVQLSHFNMEVSKNQLNLS
jgi:hypothetical protein